MACGDCGKKKVNGNNELTISQIACRPCDYTVTACCLIEAPTGFQLADVIPPATVAYNLNLNCNINECDVACTVADFGDCEAPPITTTAVVQQVVLTGSIDFVVNAAIVANNCDQQSAVACCNVSALVDNAICIFPVDAELVNCDGGLFCPTLEGSILTTVELTPIVICGVTAFEANITLTFNRDVICGNFLVQ